MLQLAACIMSLIGTPFVAAHEVLALLVECAENTSVSTPALWRMSLIQCTIVPGLACLNGFLDVRNTGLGELRFATCCAVLPRYSRRIVIGHNSLLSLNAE